MRKIRTRVPRKVNGLSLANDSLAMMHRLAGRPAGGALPERAAGRRGLRHSRCMHFPGRARFWKGYAAGALTVIGPASRAGLIAGTRPGRVRFSNRSGRGAKWKNFPFPGNVCLTERQDSFILREVWAPGRGAHNRRIILR